MAKLNVCDVCGRKSPEGAYAAKRKVTTNGAADVEVEVIVRASDPSLRLDVCSECAIDAAQKMLGEIDTRPRAK